MVIYGHAEPKEINAIVSYFKILNKKLTVFLNRECSKTNHCILTLPLIMGRLQKQGKFS